MEIELRDSDERALVDDDLTYLTKYKWRLCGKGYVFRKVHGKRVYLHHQVLGAKKWPVEVADHINRDKLDNRRLNLRWLPMACSVQNRSISKRNRSGYRAVMPVGGKYRATCGKIRLGTFASPEAAARAALDARKALMPFSVD